MKGTSIETNAVLNTIKKCVNIVIPLIIYPYVSRILGARVYGEYAFAESIMGYAALVSGFGISTYAIREGARVRDDKNGIRQITSEIFTINLITMFGALILLGVVTAVIPRICEVRTIIFIMSFDVIFNTLSRDWLNEVYEDYMYITLRYIFFQILSVTLILLFVKTSDDVVLYALFRSIAVVGGAAISILYTRKYAPICISTRKQLRKHWKPLLVFFGCSCASVIYIHSDITILGFFKSDTDVGIYSMVSKIYTLIKSVVNAVVLVMIPRAAYYIGNHKNHLYSELMRKVGNILVMLIIPAAIGIWCLSGELIQVLAGEEYINGTCALKLLSIALFFAVFSYLYAYGCLIPNSMDKYFLKATIISAMVNIIANIIFIPLFGMNVAAMTTLLAEGIMYCITSNDCRKACIAIRKADKRIIIVSMTEGICIYIASLLIQRCFSEPVIRILLLFMAGMISYLIILFVSIVILKIDIWESNKNEGTQD